MESSRDAAGPRIAEALRHLNDGIREIRDSRLAAPPAWRRRAGMHRQPAPGRRTTHERARDSTTQVWTKTKDKGGSAVCIYPVGREGA